MEPSQPYLDLFHQFTRAWYNEAILDGDIISCGLARVGRIPSVSGCCRDAEMQRSCTL